MAETFFAEVPGRVPFGGPDTTDPLAFMVYDPDREVLGKRMEDHLRIAVCLWHSFAWPGSEVFGVGTFDRPWLAAGVDPMDSARARLDAAFEFLEKLGVPYYCFHDLDVAPTGRTFAESRANLDALVDDAAGYQERTGIQLLWGTANLFTHPRYAGGASTNPDPEVFAYAAAQVRQMLEVTQRLGGTNYVLSGGADADSGARLHFVTRLRKAVDAQRWTLYYQPVVDLEDGRMVGVEALIRWIEPDGTIIPPNDFIPLAEELGLIERIGDWVVRELTYHVSAWQELDIDLEVGFNLSPRQFWQPDLADRIQREFRTGGVDPSRVLVEVTETSAMMDPDRAQVILRELTDAGFSIAIDDFGTGYSSLSRLRHMPVRVLKIDRSFVSNVQEDRQAASIVTAFLELASGLDLVALAEGIETLEELAFLRERGCKLGQGYYFSKPVPPEEIIAYAFGGLPTAVALGGAS